MNAPRIDLRAACDAREVGTGTTVAAFAQISERTVIGERCVIGTHAVLGDDVVLGADVVIGDAAVVSGGIGWRTEVGQNARIGANATVHSGVTVGRGSIVEPGAVVADAVPPNAIVGGNPARIVGYVSATPTGLEAIEPVSPTGDQVQETRVPGVQRRPVQRVDDLRGTLAALEHSTLPFQPQRIFSVFDVPNQLLRGAHAHRVCWQFLMCLTGSVRCVVDDGHHRDEVELEGAHFGLLVPPGVWGTQYRYTKDAVLLVLASHPYDPDDYIRDYDMFLEEVRST